MGQHMLSPGLPDVSKWSGRKEILQGKLKKRNVGGLLTSKAERNIWGHSDLNNIN